MKNLSPSLEIYKFPVTAITSIFNRVTGIALSGMFVCGDLFVCLKRTPFENLYNKLPSDYKQV